ncbi:MAG: MBL fold metallo-hydrolase [Oscillospiraceae bacterium]|jgi:competence protein ComEC
MKRFILHSKKTRSAIITFLVLIIFLAAGRPYGAESVWNSVFAFFGLGHFSSCADQYPAAVHILDVGKADSILVECEGHQMLVDGGTSDSGEHIIQYLKQRGISRLEYVINTHPDEDHVGGLKYVLESFSVEMFLLPEIRPELVPKDTAYIETMNSLRRKGLSATVAKAGDVLTLGGMNIHVVGPLSPGNNTNNSSIVLLLRYGDIRFLLTGDAEKEEEQSLLASGANLTADVLKVGHHGSSTSTTLEFLNAVHPKFAAISVGYDRNKLPKNDVLKRLYNANVKTYRTDVNGTIIFLTDGKTIHVVTEK